MLGCHRNWAAGPDRSNPGDGRALRGGKDRRTLEMANPLGEPDRAPRQAPVKQQLFHKVPRREVRLPLPLLSSPDGGTGQACNSDYAKFKENRRRRAASAFSNMTAL